MTTENRQRTQWAQVGDVLPPQTHRPTTVDLFRYSAVTWNSHRIHYDPAYAAEEGYPDVLVQSHLHAAYLCTLCTDWMGSEGQLLTFESAVRRFALPGDVLTCEGRVTSREERGDEVVVGVDLAEVRSADQAVCADGRATVVFRLEAAAQTETGTGEGGAG